MARGFNNVKFVGCLTKDSELKYTASGLAILEMNIAGSDNVAGDDGQSRDIAWYHRVSVFGKQAEYLAEGTKQGQVVFVDGKLNYRSWETEAGKRSALDVKALRVDLMSHGGRGKEPTVLDSIGQPRLKNAVNEITLIGNLTRDSEMRYTPNGNAVTNIGIAVNEQYRDRNGEDQESVHFIDIQCWRQLAESCAELSKGNAILVVGRLVNDSWQDQEGNKRYRTYLEASRVEFLDKSPDSNSSNHSKPEIKVTEINTNASKLDIDEEFPPEEDLPF